VAQLVVGVNRETKQVNCRSKTSLVRVVFVLVLSAASATFAGEVKITGGPYTLNGDLVIADGVLEGIDLLHCDAADVMSSTCLSYYRSSESDDTLFSLRKMGVPILPPILVPKMGVPILLPILLPILPVLGRDTYAYDVVDVAIGEMEGLEQPKLIALASSLQDDGKRSRATGKPIIVFISQKGCEYCHLLRTRVLIPMIRAGEFKSNAILREVSLDPGTKLRDFDGAELSGRDFAARYEVFVTPTLLFLNSEGQKLADPIIGTSNIDLYEFYLKRAIDNSTKILGANSSLPR